MADKTSSTEKLSVIGFTGTLLRHSAGVELFFKDQQGQEFKDIQICEQNGEISYQLGRETALNNKKVLLEAVVSDSPDGKGFLIALPDPTRRDRLIGIAVAPDDVRPEVDGVWVADEGGGDDEENEGSY